MRGLGWYTFLLALLLAFLPTPSVQAEPAPAARDEARQRFDRGLVLFDEGDNAGALAEFRRAYELVPHRLVLYNMGLCYAALNRPIEATRALDEVLRDPAPLPGDRLALARRTRDEQARRVGALVVTTNVPAAIEIDGVEVGHTPLGQPLPIAVGTRVVAATSPGYLPLRKEISVAGRTTTTLDLALSPSELRLAHLQLYSPVPDAEVRVDGTPVGKTPLPGSLTVLPGRRQVELHRAGYAPVRREIELGDGAVGQLAIDLEEMPGPDSGYGRLVLAASESEPEIVIDGRPRGVYRGPLSLPSGGHHVRIASAGFVTSQRLVRVVPGADTVVKVSLVPTAETRAAYVGRTRTQRRWAWAGLASGGVLLAGGTVLTALSQGALTDARSDRASLLSSFEGQGRCRSSGPNYETCTRELAEHDDRVNGRTQRRNLGLIAAGVGLAAAGVGLTLLLTGDDPHRYDRPSGGDAGFDVGLLPVTADASGAVAGGGVVVAGRF